MTDFTWDISFQLTGTFLTAGFVATPNVAATVTGTIVTDSDSGILQQSDFGSYSFTYSAPSVGFSGSASGGQFLSLVGNIFSASGDTLSYVVDPVATLGAYAFFGSAPGDPSQVAFGIDLAFHDFVQGDIRLQDSSFNQLDATVTQPFLIGTEVVATLADISIVGTSQTDADLSTISNVSGNVTISDNEQLGSIDLSNLQSVGGNFILTDNPALLTINLPSLGTVGGNVDVSGDTSATSVNLGGLMTVTGNVDVSGDTSATSVNLGDLSTVDGNVDVSGDTSATSVNLGSLMSVTGNVDVSGDTSATSVNLGSLMTVTGNVDVSGDTSATSVNLGSLMTVTGNVDVSGDTSATSINLGSLDTTGGDVTIDSGADATLDASALGPGGGTVELIGDNLTTSITLGSLDHLGGTLTISSADGVTLTSHAGLTDLAITGTDADNTLIGSATANNTVDGKLGNDLMTGGSADDAFVFDFSVSQHTEFHHDFVSLADITSVTIDDSIHFKPAPTGSITAWQVWDNALTTYANSQADNTGGDNFTAFTNSNPVAKNVGTIQLIDGYFHDYNTTVTDLAGSGFDTINNFANSALSVTNGGGGNDVLVFNGLSSDQNALNYWGNWLSSTTENGNTVIDVHDVAHNSADVSLITLLGVTTDVTTLVHDGLITFNPVSTLPVSDWHV